MSNTTDLSPIDLRTEAFADFMADYPRAADVDVLDELPLQRFTADDTGDVFEARVLGFGSSYRKTHLNHAPGTKPRGSCSRCRWTDTAILWARALKWVDEAPGYRPASPWQYVFVSLGKSVIEGEKQWDTVVWAEDAEDVLRLLFVPTKANFQRDKGAKAIPPHNAAAFREAAYIDDAIADVVDRYEPVIPNVERSGDDADPLAGL